MAAKAPYDPVAETPGLLKAVAPHNRAFELDAAAAALLVVDMQNYFLHPYGHAYMPQGAAIIPNVARLVAAFRAARRPVIFTRHGHDRERPLGLMGEWWDGALYAGTRDAEIVKELAPAPAELVVYKDRYSAFAGTDLHPRLRALRLRDLVIAGVMTNLCCETTARDAFMRDFRVFVAADGTAAASLDLHRAALLNLAYGFAVVGTCDAFARAMAAANEKRAAPGAARVSDA